MKKIIRLLARIAGVETDIKHQTITEIGYTMQQDAWWFSADGYQQAYNVLHLYADSLKKNKKTPMISNFRDRIRMLGNNRIDGHNTDQILKRK